jgi:hypothetical protein
MVHGLLDTAWHTDTEDYHPPTGFGDIIYADQTGATTAKIWKHLATQSKAAGDVLTLVAGAWGGLTPDWENPPVMPPGTTFTCYSICIHFKGTEGDTVTINDTADLRSHQVVGWIRTSEGIPDHLIDLGGDPGDAYATSNTWPPSLVTADLNGPIVRCSADWSAVTPPGQFYTPVSRVEVTTDSVNGLCVVIYLSNEIAVPAEAANPWDGDWAAKAYVAHTVVQYPAGTYWIATGDPGPQAGDVPGVAGNWTPYRMPEAYIHVRVVDFGETISDAGQYVNHGNVNP